MTITPILYFDFVADYYWYRGVYVPVTRFLGGPMTIGGNGLALSASQYAVATAEFLALLNSLIPVMEMGIEFQDNTSALTDNEIFNAYNSSSGGTHVQVKYEGGSPPLTVLNNHFSDFTTFPGARGQYILNMGGGGTFEFGANGVLNTTPGGYPPFNPVDTAGFGPLPGADTATVQWFAIYPYNSFDPGGGSAPGFRPGDPGPPPPIAPEINPAVIVAPIPTPMPCVPCCETSAPIC